MPENEISAKIASQNGTIRLFGGGTQLKSLVPLIDTARCFKFMEEKDDIKNETFAQWIQDLSTRVKSLIYDKKDLWFQNHLEYQVFLN